MTLLKHRALQTDVLHQQTHKYYLGQGNNSALVGRILSTRLRWTEVSDPKYIFANFRWQQTSKSYKYEQSVDSKVFKQCLNHFEFHQELSNKEYLFKNLWEYCSLHEIDVFDIVPLTFVINMSDGQCQNSMNAFLQVYNRFLPENLAKIDKAEKNDITDGTTISNINFSNDINVEKKTVMFIKKKRSVSSRTGGYKPRGNMVVGSMEAKKFKMDDVFTGNDRCGSLSDLNGASSYLWILKPTFQNRGNGIHVFSTLQNLETLINSYIAGDTTNMKPMSQESSSSPQIKSKSFRIREYCNPQRPAVTSFVVQKYIQRPLLIDGRKFDIRMWVLISHQMKVHLFKQGYIRTSSYKYSTDSATLSDNNIHLTNNAVQKNNTEYGKYEDGNQLSFKVLKHLVEKEGGNFNEVMSRIKLIVKLTALSVRKKLNKNERANCFEIFGYDFMLDINCKPWLIEVNTNPCIEESSGLLQTLLPRMLDDAFCLTLDRIFQTQKKGYNYSIENQYSTDNLWQLIVDLKKTNSVGLSQNAISQSKRIVPK